MFDSSFSVNFPPILLSPPIGKADFVGKSEIIVEVQKIFTKKRLLVLNS